MTYSCPVLRYGAVCSATDKMSLRESEALETGIWEQRGDITSRAIEHLLPTAKGVRGDLRTGRRSVDEGHIIHFPKLTVAVENFSMAVRPTASICRGSAHSKIWIHTRLLGSAEAERASIESSELADFYSLSLAVCEAASDSYFEDYRKALATVSCTQDVDIQHRLYISTVGFDSPLFPEAMDSLAGGKRLSDLREDERFACLVDALSAAERCVPYGELSRKTSGADTDVRWFGMRTRGGMGLFSERHVEDRSGTWFDGVVYSPLLLSDSSAQPTYDVSGALVKRLACLL